MDTRNGLFDNRKQKAIACILYRKWHSDPGKSLRPKNNRSLTIGAAIKAKGVVTIKRSNDTDLKLIASS